MFDNDKMVHTTTYVSYEVLDEEKKILESFLGANCFANITFSSFEDIKNDRLYKKDIRYIHFFFKDSSTPYHPEFMEKYASLCRELGFPFTYNGKDVNGVHHIWIDINELNDKRIMLNSTLILARYLLESGINYLPDVIFKLIEQGVEPFIALQQAHNSILGKEYSYGRWGYANANHAIKPLYTTNHIEPYFTKYEFFEQVDKSDITIFKHSQIGVRDFWIKENKYVVYDSDD